VHHSLTPARGEHAAAAGSWRVIIDDMRPSHLPAVGRRGGGWVAGQVALIAAVGLSALAGRDLDGSAAVAAHAVGGVVLGAGIALIAAAGLRLGSSLTPYPHPRSDTELTTAGAYALVRHPMYGSGILIALGWSILFATWVGAVLTVVLAAFLDLKSRREEAWLVERVEGYADYRRETRHRLLPFLY
jgi:protein-S-isoprenylcysteine O-methyltransferase Ste14